MAHIHAARVADTSATTGTSDFTLANSPPTAFRTLNDVCATSDTFYYVIQNRDASEWEEGLGTYSGSHVFVRTVVFASSNANAAVNFSSGTKDVFIADIAARHNFHLINAQTGTTYTVVAADNGKLVTFSNASSVAVTLPQATTAFSIGWSCFVHNKGAGTVTITPTTSTINGGSTLVLTTGQGALIVSDGTNYQTNSGGYLPLAGGTLTGPLSIGTSNAFTAGTIDLGAASDTTIARSAAGKISVEGKAVKLAGIETIFVPAVAMVARTTNGAASGTAEMSTNKNMFRTLDFDTTTQEFAQFAIRMPKSWDEGTITAAFTWSHASTTTNFGVVWALEGVACSDDDAGDVAFGTAQQVADTGGTTNDVYVTSATSAITIAGSPAAEDYVMFQVKRVPSDGSDTMAIDARLHGVTLYITTNDVNDA